MILDPRHHVAIGASKEELSDFVRVVQRGARRIILLVDGHTCGWDLGVGEIARPVMTRALAVLERGLGAEAAMEAAREAFHDAAAPHPEDEMVGGPSAQLTIVEIEDGVVDCTRMGGIRVFMRRAHEIHIDRAERASSITRARADAVRSRTRLVRGDLVVVAPRWGGIYCPPDPIQALMLSHDDPEALVSAALDQHRRDVEAAQRAGRLIGEPPYWLAATIV